jgi:hypothetical protein
VLVSQTNFTLKTSRKVNLIIIEQQDNKLIFEQLKRSEILIINNEDKFEIFVNIESAIQSEEEKILIESKYGTKLSEFITYTWSKLQFMNMSEDELNRVFTEKIHIIKGWENELKMAGIYVGWGVETHENEIEMKIQNDLVNLNWTCIVDDMDRYDSDFKPFRAQIQAELKVLRFDTKQEFWEYEKEKLDGKK